MMSFYFVEYFAENMLNAFSFDIVRGLLTGWERLIKRLGGRVVMQRTATPCTPVRFRPQPPISKEIEPGRRSSPMGAKAVDFFGYPVVALHTS